MRLIQRLISARGQYIPEPPRPFITTWQTTTASESITIPTTGAGYDFEIDWGDGTTVETKTTGNPSHTYAEPGIHTVQISGNFPRIYLYGNPTMATKIRSVEQRGDVEWTSMEYAFWGASNLAVVATDAPQFNTVSTISFSNMFMAATNLTGNFNHWDTSKVTNMNRMFNGASSFNQPIGNWDTSNVTNMNYMFSGANMFNQDLSSRCVLKIPSMPTGFDNETFSWVGGRQPVWGTCPDQS